MGIRIGKSQEEGICSDYKRGHLSIGDVSLKWGVSVATVGRVLRRRSVNRDRVSGPRTKIALNDSFFESIDTEERAYWLGFVAADGNVYRHQNGGYHFGIKLAARDSGHLELFKRSVGSSHRIIIGESFSKVTGRSYPYCTIRIVRRKFVGDLMEHLPMPELPDALESHFIRGCFDGDGSWTIRRNQLAFSLRASSDDGDMIYRIQDVLMRCCSLSETVIGFNTGAYRLGYEGNSQCRRIFEFLYSGASLRMERKYAKAAGHLEAVDR